MSWSARCLRLAERITGRACRCLPDGERGEWYQVWVAELPAFLDDADGGPLPLRAARMLWCSGDHYRAARRIAAITRPRKLLHIPSAIDITHAVLAVLAIPCFLALMAAGALSQAAYDEQIGYVPCMSYMTPCSGNKIPPDPALSHLDGHLAWMFVQGGLLALLVMALGCLFLCVSRLRRRRVARTGG
ncbi:MAG: hypothetical protein JO345_35990 [Streptosporangiaceae bacterium]|nr:hypothetical protein [Streptosporangiaceae bacterium]